MRNFKSCVSKVLAYLSELFNDVFFPSGVVCLTCESNPCGQFLCPDCARGLHAVRLAGRAGNQRAAYHYEGVARELVINLKHRRIAACADLLADEMALVATEMNLPPDTVCTWVTMPKRRLRERGIDHGRTLCEAVARRLELPSRQLFQRVGKLHTQQGLNREKRLKNLQHTIVCQEKINFPVLLIDDVMTTGATMQACCKALEDFGAAQVYMLTATQVVSAKEKRS